MNLKIDFNSSLTDFETNCQAADAALDDKSNNIITIIYSGLQLASCLSFDFDIDSYCELHSTCLIYFANLRKALSDKSRFGKDKLNAAFEISLSCPYVLPRLYLALVVACTSKNKEKLKLMSEMLLAVSHPLRGLLLRFTAISFFPKCPELADFLVDFAVTNFKEMMFLLSSFLKIYPKSKQLACQWLTSNTTISLFLSDNNPNIVKSFFDFAKGCKENYVSIAIVDSISQSIEGPQIPKYFDLFADFFKTKAREETAKMKRNKILQANKRGAISNNKSQPRVNPIQNQSKPKPPITETTPPSQNQPVKNPNTSVIQTSQLPRNPYSTQQPSKQAPPSHNASTVQQHQQQSQPSKSQIQINRPQPSAVAMPPMGRVALPPMRPMTSVAMPPILLPQQKDQQQQQQQKQNNEQNDENELKKDEEQVDTEKENENVPDGTDALTEADAEADALSEFSNAEEDLNEDSNNINEEDENENEELNQQLLEAKTDESSTRNDELEKKEDINPKTETENPNKIRLNQSFSDPQLMSEHKTNTETPSSVLSESQVPQTTQPQATTSEQETASNSSAIPLKAQLSTSLSSPSLSPNQPQPSQPHKQQQQRKPQQKQARRQGNTLYNATKHIAIACLEKCDNPREAFRFIQMTPFSEACGLEVTRLALRMNDLEVVKMCAARWMKYSVLHEILVTLGYKAFAEIVPPNLPGGLDITKEFIQKVTETTEGDSSDAEALRKILSNELIDRSIELDGYINELIITHNNYNELFYRTLFADPYRFHDFFQISTVVSRYTSSFLLSSSIEEADKETMKKTVLGFIDRTKIAIQNLIALRCGVYENGEKSDTLVTKALEIIQDSVINFNEYGNKLKNINNANNNDVSYDSNLSLLNDNRSSYSSVLFNKESSAVIPVNIKSDETASVARRILISHLQRLEISDNSLELLFEQCASFVKGEGFLPNSNAKKEITSFILLAAIKGNKILAEKALITLLDMDVNTTKLSDQIHLYFEAINIIISITENETDDSCLISKDTTKRILLQIIDTIKALENYKKFFPIMTPCQSNYLVKIADIAKNKKYFAEFEELFNNIIELMKNC